MAATKRKPARSTAKKKATKKPAASRAKAKPKARTATKSKAKARKPAARKPAARKPAAKRSPAKKATAKKATAKKSPVKLVRTAPPSRIDKAFTKGQLISTLAGSTGLNRKDVALVLEDLRDIIAVHMKKQGPRQFTLPGLIKITVKHKPATKARKGVNPFTGEEMMFKAKPARNVVKVRPLQNLKEMV